MSKSSFRIHNAAAFRITGEGIASGTACRPDGEYGRTLHASDATEDVTCRACLKALTY